MIYMIKTVEIAYDWKHKKISYLDADQRSTQHAHRPTNPTPLCQEHPTSFPPRHFHSRNRSTCHPHDCTARYTPPFLDFHPEKYTPGQLVLQGQNTAFLRTAFWQNHQF